jgi:hypothetical protein
VTPPGGDNGAPGTPINGWKPDLINTENRLSAALLVRM